MNGVPGGGFLATGAVLDLLVGGSAASGLVVLLVGTGVDLVLAGGREDGNFKWAGKLPCAWRRCF